MKKGERFRKRIAEMSDEELARLLYGVGETIEMSDWGCEISGDPDYCEKGRCPFWYFCDFRTVEEVHRAMGEEE